MFCIGESVEKLHFELTLWVRPVTGENQMFIRDFILFSLLIPVLHGLYL